ncbi:cytochrome b [Prosthecomicrobium sp. N25]|uniref:cytochrome b n=1 Tax=Prosthecomicrobium sp. N25 TaxID=3129254 RepID=UPI0030787B93
MTVRDTDQGYGPLSIALHWIGGALVVALFILGNRMEDLPRGPELAAAKSLHIGVGMLAFALLAFRIAWRAANPVPPLPTGQPAALDRLARLVQVAMLATIAILIVSGPLSIWASGRPIEVFGIVSLGSPLPKMNALKEGLEIVHSIAAKVILVLVGLHVLGALKHLVVDRDGVVRRMLVPVRGG